LSRKPIHESSNQFIPLNQVSSEVAPASGANHHVQIMGTTDASAQLIILNLSRLYSKTIVVVPGHRDATPLLAAFEGNKDLLRREQVTVSYLPHLSLWGTDRFINPGLSRGQRLDSLFNLTLKNQRHLIVTTLAGLTQCTMPASLLERFSIGVQVGAETDQDDLIRSLEAAGYKSSSMVDEEGLLVSAAR
jgi:transcription-repair coupling factor (superfamily II helicase)